MLVLYTTEILEMCLLFLRNWKNNPNEKTEFTFLPIKTQSTRLEGKESEPNM
jgi:hypothetical protein